MTPLFAEVPPDRDEADFLVLQALRKYSVREEAWDSRNSKTLPEFLDEVHAGELVLHVVRDFIRARHDGTTTRPKDRIVASSDRVCTAVRRVNPQTGQQEQ